MMRTLLVRGLIAGLIAGIAAALFAFFVGEPQVDAAIAVEEAAAAAAHDHGEEELVSRGVQSTIGLFTAQTAFGVAFGGLFSLVFAFLYGRLGGYSARAYSAALAVGAFTVVNLVPFLKYPGNPPAVGNPDTITERSELHFGFLAISLLAAGVAVYAAKVLSERHGGWNAAVLTGAGYVGVMTLCAIVLPPVDEFAEGFPAVLLWEFRIASLGNLLVLWVTLGLVFGALAQHALTTRQAPTAENVTA